MLVRFLPAIRACVIGLAVLPAAASAQQEPRIRARSSVLLRPPDSTIVVAAPTRPRTASVNTAVLAGATRTDSRSPLVIAATPALRGTARRVPGTRVTTPVAPAPASDSAVTPQAAARRLATSLYGRKAKLETVAVINERAAGVWVGDAAEKQPAPRGLDVKEGVVLPFRYIVLDPSRGDMMALKPWFDDGGGLRYDSQRGAYVGTLRIGLSDTLHGSQRRALSPRIRISVTSTADSVTPELLEISETNLFVTKARLVTRRIANALRVTVWPEFTQKRVDLWIPFQPDSVILSVDRPEIAGFALEDVNVTVELSPGAAAPTDSIAVSLSSTGGTFSTGPVVYPKGGTPVVTRLRSSGLGPQLITARAGVLLAGERKVQFGFPYGLLVGAVLGALLGSIMLVLRERKRPDAPAAGWLVASGVIAGLLTAIVAAAGLVKIPGFTLPAGGGALISVLAGALGGYVGPKGFEVLFGAFGAGKAKTANL